MLIFIEKFSRTSLSAFNSEIQPLYFSFLKEVNEAERILKNSLCLYLIISTKSMSRILRLGKISLKNTV